MLVRERGGCEAERGPIIARDADRRPRVRCSRPSQPACSSPTSPATRATSPGWSSITRRTSWPTSSARWSPRSGRPSSWPSWRGTPRSWSASPDKVDGSLLLDVIERCYFGFRRRRRDVRQATTCECNACVRIPDLNLKFVAHVGLIGRQRMAGPRRARRVGRHRRPPAAQEHRRRGDRGRGLRPPQPGLRRRDEDRRRGARYATPRRDLRAPRRGPGLDPRPRAALAGRGAAQAGVHRACGLILRRLHSHPRAAAGGLGVPDDARAGGPPGRPA